MHLSVGVQAHERGTISIACPRAKTICRGLIVFPFIFICIVFSCRACTQRPFVLLSILYMAGGPNTMVAGAWNSAIAEAVRMSSAIENSGQCTALRHLVAPGATEADIVEAYGKQPVMDAAVDALAAKEFSAIFTKQPFSLAPGYTAHPSGSAFMGFW
jgi:hypothetical protein